MNPKKDRGKLVTLHTKIPEALHRRLRMALLWRRIKITDWMQSEAKRVVEEFERERKESEKCPIKTRTNV
jgi:hypothetical protein